MAPADPKNRYSDAYKRFPQHAESLYAARHDRARFEQLVTLYEGMWEQPQVRCDSGRRRP